MIRAAYQLVDQDIAEPVLLGDRDRINAVSDTLGLGDEVEDIVNLAGVAVVDAQKE